MTIKHRVFAWLIAARVSGFDGGLGRVSKEKFHSSEPEDVGSPREISDDPHYPGYDHVDR